MRDTHTEKANEAAGLRRNDARRAVGGKQKFGRLRKLDRCEKRQRGQYLTPARVAASLIDTLDLRQVRRVLEPSCGDGSFLLALLNRLMNSSASPRRNSRMATRLVGIEIDPVLLKRCRRRLPSRSEMAASRVECSLALGDFFQDALRCGASKSCEGAAHLDEPFDLIIGNPPFGGSFDPAIEDELDARFGQRFDRKIKKETYAFFIVACAELLRPGGRLVFICADSLLTIPTMTGLRHYLMETGRVSLRSLDTFSSETAYPMLVLDYIRGESSNAIERDGETIEYRDVRVTPNSSWGVTADIARLFDGPTLGDRFVATSGMTTGRNEYFVRTIRAERTIEEPYHFRFTNPPIEVSRELKLARLNRIPARRLAQLAEAEARGETHRRVSVERRRRPQTIALPHPDYRPYNKANGRIVFSPPTHVIYWRDNGDAVLTFKRSGNWYLRGVGGQPFFGREGLTWQLVAGGFIPRYLPSGYILDSGAPCAFLRKGADRRELYFILAWLLSPLANRVLKTVINHTRNIQSKDFERMPYPWWVSASDRSRAIRMIDTLIREAKRGATIARDDARVCDIGVLFEFDRGAQQKSAAPGSRRRRPLISIASG